MAEETKQNAETTEATTEKKEGIILKCWNFIKSHAKGIISVGAGVGAGFLLACLAGGGNDDDSDAGDKEYYEYSSSEEGDVEEGGSEE